MYVDGLKLKCNFFLSYEFSPYRRQSEMMKRELLTFAKSFQITLEQVEMLFDEKYGKNVKALGNVSSLFDSFCNEFIRMNVHFRIIL